MPFDGIDGFDSHPLAKLGAVERLLGTEQQWCKGRLRDAHGRHCLVGAIEAVGGRQVLQKPVLQAAREVSGKRYWRIEFFNDDPRTTHGDVLQVLQRARENMIAGMINDYDRQPRFRRWLHGLRGRHSQRTHDTAAETLSAQVEARLLPGETTFEPGDLPHRGPHPRAERTKILELQY